MPLKTVWSSSVGGQWEPLRQLWTPRQGHRPS